MRPYRIAINQLSREIKRKTTRAPSATRSHSSGHVGSDRFGLLQAIINYLIGACVFVRRALRPLVESFFSSSPTVAQGLQMEVLPMNTTCWGFDHPAPLKKWSHFVSFCNVLLFEV